MGGVKAFLTKTGPFGLPVYAYVGGAVALIGGIWYFKTHNTGAATVAPQTVANPVTDTTGTAAPPMPFPSGSGAPVPPSPAFSTGSPTDSSAAFALPNWVPKFYRDPTTGAVYLITQTGKIHLTPADWAAYVAQGFNYTNVDPGALNQIPNSTANFIPTSPQSTTSQTFANGVVPNPSITNRWKATGARDLPVLASMSSSMPVGR